MMRVEGFPEGMQEFIQDSMSRNMSFNFFLDCQERDRPANSTVFSLPTTGHRVGLSLTAHSVARAPGLARGSPPWPWRPAARRAPWDWPWMPCRKRPTRTGGSPPGLLGARGFPLGERPSLRVGRGVLYSLGNALKLHEYSAVGVV